MIKRPGALVHAASISLLLLFSPSLSIAQDQKDAPLQQPGGAAAEQPQTPPAATTAVQPPAAPAQNTAEAEEQTPSAKEAYAEHVIKQGDTLWDIANRYLRDPFLWPFIWRANPSISNPDLIYAGSKLAIPSLAPIERAMQAPAAQPKSELAEKEAPARQAAPKSAQAAPPVPAQEESKPVEGFAAARVLKPKTAVLEEQESAAPVSKLIMPEEERQPIIDKYSMLNAGYVDDFASSDVIVRGRDEAKTIFGFGDEVFVSIKSKQSVKVGDKYVIYTVEETVRHPKTGARFGSLVRGLGILEITKNDPSTDILTARITLSFDSAAKDDMLLPYQEPALVYPQTARKTKDITGYILEVTNQHTISGQTEFVYLDKGKQDGVEAGDRFTVYEVSRDRDLPLRKIGEVQAFVVRERTSTAVIRNSIDAISKGNQIVYIK